MYTEAKYRT